MPREEDDRTFFGVATPAQTPVDKDYRAAMAAARMGGWETNLVDRTRKWSPEAMQLFGFELPGGIGTVGGEADEYLAALHPDDRHVMHRFHETANAQDFYEGDYRVVRPDGTVRWVTGRALVVERGADGKARRTVTVVTDITEQKETEEHARFLLRELSHRSRNLIAVIQGIARRTARTSVSLEEFEQRFESRLAALSASHNVLASQDWRAAPLDVLVREQLASFVEADAARVDVQGPRVLVNANSAQVIGLAIHELATNAIKHGSLAVPVGRVRVDWAFGSDPGRERQLRIRWSESDGPTISKPTRSGFGQTVVNDMFVRMLGAEVRMDFSPQGLSWTADVPMRSLAVEHAPS